MKCFFKLIFLIGILPLTLARRVQFYRKDYTYIEEFDAFYKLHWDLFGASWNSAFLACDDEEATLFYPKIKGEWNLVRNLTNNMAETPNVTDIFVGLHDEFGVGEFVTVDGGHLMFPGGNCVMLNIETGMYRTGSCVRDPDHPLPFVCKKVETEFCPTVDRGYKYVKSLKKCYKVNERPKMWDEAMRTCYMEGGILTVIQNEEEANTIRKMMKGDSHYFVGIRRILSRGEYYTVKGQQRDMVFQNERRDRYNEAEEQNADCGAMYNTYTMTTDCGTRLPFICEMEVKD
ncbi:uncharacterized protein LOC142977059 isoform X2 [Anticarsia gemmatalis]|uniref:uncharacterized protein LOC142977059 isoform X2 n=1 Tax=Anticarsia gemmatalis TaxID=129554 RepID=UPI003F7638D3